MFQMNASNSGGSGSGSNAFLRGEGCNKYVIPGDRLFPISEQLKAGIGTYELFGHIYASLAGALHMYATVELGVWKMLNRARIEIIILLFLQSNLQRDKETKIVEVRRESEKEKRHVMPYVGCIATAKVQNIGQRFAKCTIHCVECSVLSHEFNGILRKEDIMPIEKEKVKLDQCIHPGDVILARVIGFGDNQHSYLLSIVEDELGVVSGIGDLGERMIPCSFGEVKSVITGIREPRKVAHIPDLNH
uniref:Exosome complex component CSL4 C-terminal domain-containing protein n=1 Tax=Wuchereria bancrofti TaxID=6293 RepID=A0A1I8EEG1_WUCBA